jgi:adenosylcobinamide kinase/adenosylcobinamide-phosphate guanylyltransferase
MLRFVFGVLLFSGNNVMKELILGGTRSGKSQLAEQHAYSSGLNVFYIATATSSDADMAQRIKLHRQRRPRSWETIEEPLMLVPILKQISAPDHCIIVDCLTLWITNMLINDDDLLMQQECDALGEQIKQLPGSIIMVSNENSLGVLPADNISRQFCDVAGSLHQKLAHACDRVILVIAGLPQVLKGEPL